MSKTETRAEAIARRNEAIAKSGYTSEEAEQKSIELSRVRKLAFDRLMAATDGTDEQRAAAAELSSAMKVETAFLHQTLGMPELDPCLRHPHIQFSDMPNDDSVCPECVKEH